MNHRARIPALLLVLALLLGCAGCGGGREPVTVTIWHVYGGETESPLNDRIDTFNDTVGREQNIRVQVGSVTNTNTIHEAVLASAYGEPGATALPGAAASRAGLYRRCAPSVRRTSTSRAFAARRRRRAARRYRCTTAGIRS